MIHNVIQNLKPCKNTGGEEEVQPPFLPLLIQSNESGYMKTGLAFIGQFLFKKVLKLGQILHAKFKFRNGLKLSKHLKDTKK